MSVGKNVWPMHRKTKLKNNNKQRTNKRIEHYYDAYGGSCPSWCRACIWEKENPGKKRP